MGKKVDEMCLKLVKTYPKMCKHSKKTKNNIANKVIKIGQKIPRYIIITHNHPKGAIFGQN